MAISVLSAAQRREKGVVVKTRLIAAMVAALLLVTLGGATSGHARPTATVKIAALCDQSGPTSDIGTSYCLGEIHYMAYFNARGGFANKDKVNFAHTDYGYNVARALQVYSQQADGAAAFLGWGTADTTALTARITADKLPYLSASYAEQLTDPKDTPYNFVAATNYSAQTQIALKHIAKTRGHHEVAFFHNNSAFGTAPIEGAKAYIDRKNLDIGFKTYAMISGSTSFDAQLLQARDQGADYIIVQNVPTPAATLMKDVKRIGLKARVVCLNYCGSELWVKLAGSAANGALAVQPWTPVAFKVPGMKAPGDYLKRRGSSLAKQGLGYLQGWYTAALMCEAINTVVKRGDAVNGPNIKDALETMPAFRTGGVAYPIKFQKSGNYAHDGMSGSRIYVVKKGVFTKVPKTGFIVP
jgi:branched-chain amino acid transport system substrate-binding protein